MIEKVKNSLSQIREVRYITITSGEYPLLIQINVQNQEDIRDFIFKMDKIEGVISYNTIIQLENYKNTFEYL